MGKNHTLVGLSFFSEKKLLALCLFLCAGNNLTFLVGGKQAFEVSLADVSQTQLQGKNDVLLEFHVDDTAGANEVYTAIWFLLRNVISGLISMLAVLLILLYVFYRKTR